MSKRSEAAPLLENRSSKEKEFSDEIINYNRESSKLYRNFILMSLAFSINHGSVTSCLAYSTTELGDDLGGFGSGCLYVCYALTALLIAKPIVAMVGPKNGLLLGLIGYCVYVAGFLIAILIPLLAWPIFIVSACIGGIAGGLLWPSQGKYFAKNALLYSENTNIPIDIINSKFAGIFAGLYLGMEMITKILATVLFLTVPPTVATAIVFIVYTGLAVFCSFVMARLSNLDEYGTWDLNYNVVIDHVGSASKLVATDARLALMIPFQIAFGFCSGFVPFYVFGTVIAGSSELGATYVGLLSAIIVLTGASMAMPAAYLSNVLGKPTMMTIGGLCLSFSGFIFFFLSDKQLGTWGLIIPYLIIYGIGRGTWENTNKAVVADLFVTTPEHSTAAFASVAFFNGLAGAIGYFCFPNIARIDIASIVFVSAIIGIISYWASAVLHARYEKEQQLAESGGIGEYTPVIDPEQENDTEDVA